MLEGRTRLSYSLGKPLQVWLESVQRDSAVSAVGTVETPEPGQCACRMYRTGAELDLRGHVVTTDPGCLKSAQLRRLLLYGRKYRLPQNPEGIIPAVQEGLEGYVAKHANAGTLAEYDEWKTAVLSKVKLRMDQLVLQGMDIGFTLDAESTEELRQLRQTMTVTFADKSTHDFVLVCRHAYQAVLKAELASHKVYQPLHRPVEQVLEEHAKWAEKCGLDPVQKVAHLYGGMKLHKVPVGLRWIAGASAVELANGTWYATTSIGQSAAALGGILRQVMAVLRRKDERLFRQTGVRRYWIITSAEEAAGRLKCLNPRLLGRIWTRDFSAMYTSLPRERLVTQVSEAVHEAFCAQAAALNLEAEKLGMSVKYDYKKKATAEFEIGGRFTEQDIRQLLETVLEGTLLQQGPGLEVLEQKQGIPMGGKASAEIANLYCYNVEATTVAKAMQDYGLPAARKYATCMRFIDDLIGFGEISWPSLQYGMEHAETAGSDSQVVFLGMKITKHEDWVQLELQPKGAAWTWRPQRYLEATSTHTHYTRRSIFKGQAVRAGRITNSRKAFKEAVLYAAESLLLRGYGSGALHRSWESYLKTYFQRQPGEQRVLREWFSTWLHAIFPEETKAASQAVRRPAAREFAADIHSALNAVFQTLGLPGMSTSEVEAAVERRLKMSDPRGVTEEEIVSHVGGQRGLKGVQVEPEKAQEAQLLMAHQGRRWTVFVQTEQRWWRVEKAVLTKVPNVQSALRAAMGPKGRVLQLSLADNQIASGGLLLQLANAGSNSVALVPYSQPPHEPHASDMEAANDDEVPVVTENVQGAVSIENTSTALVPYAPGASQEVGAEEDGQLERLGDDGLADAPETKKSRREEEQWEHHMVGSIAVLKKGGSFKCPVPDCTFERDSAASVLKHFVRHRDKRNQELAAEDEEASRAEEAQAEGGRSSQ